MKTNVKIIITVLLLIALAVSPVSASTEKEEVVYVNLENNGDVRDVYAVNIFELREAGTITDYGNYRSVKNLLTTDPINVNGDMITVNTGSGKFYYEGTLGKADVPWDVNIRYFLNGVEYYPSAMGGKSGDLEIRISLAKNPNVDEAFYKNFAVMMTVTLDSNKCRNIISDGATIADVGADKQLSYTVMPDKGLESSIYSDVIDFEMDAISINGVRLSMEFDVDTEEMETDLTDLEDAIVDLDDGVKSLKEAAFTLKAGADSVGGGAQTLSSGLNTLDTKGAQLRAAAEKLNQSALYITEPLGSNVSNFCTAVIQYTRGVSSASAGASQLSSGTGKLSLGAYSLALAVGDLYEGTNELRDNTTGLSDELNDKLDEILDPLRGIGDPTVSFVSSKNTDVKMVQFVMHTDAIEKPEEPTPAPEPEEELNFFQRILRLFGLY
ncbi:MAG: hypothetical protein Q4Q53_05575 [Methanocorpusculum sp.]|nr:hypothetical protein [Methanocorpusculum sp.]